MFKNVQEKVLTKHFIILMMNMLTGKLSKEGKSTMAHIKNNKYVDLVIAEAKPSLFKRFSRQYRVCTVSSSRGQQFINLRMPEEMQEKIISAYQDGKTVRIFA